MAQFPIRYSERLPPAVGTNVRANLDVSTGAGAIGQGISAVGGSMFEIGANLKLANQAVKLSTMKRQHDTILQTAHIVAQSSTPEAIVDLWETAKKDVEALDSGDTKVNQLYQIWHNDTIGTWNENIVNLHQGIVKQNVYDQGIINVQGYMESGEINKAATQLEVLAKFFPKERAKLEQQILDLPNNIRLARARVEADENPDKAIAIANALENPTIKQLEVKDSIITHALAIKNREGSLSRKLQDEQFLALYEKAYIKNEPLTWEEVKSTSLATDDKTRFWGAYKNAQAEKIQTGISQIEEGDPVILAQVTAIVDLRPNDITPEQLYKLADKGLGTKHIPGLVTRLKTNQKSENPVADKYRAELASVHTAGLFGKREKPATSDIYMKLSRNLDTFLMTNPTEEQARVFFSKLIRDDVHWLFLGDQLPGWEEWPVSGKTPAGKDIKVNFGEVIEESGHIYQAVGKKADKIEWLTVK